MKTNDIDETIVYHKVKNEMPASASVTPYFGKVEVKDTLDEATVIAEMREDGCTESAETIRRILRGADAVQTRRIGEKGNKVQTGAELMMPHLTGTLPAPDAKPGEGNELTVRVDPGDGLRNALSDLTPKENREDLSKLGGVRIYSVKSEGLDWSVLKGTQPFQIAGIGFRPTPTSTVEVKVVSSKTGDAATATAACEDNQRIVAALGSVLPKGDYKVVVTVSDEGGLSGNTDASYNVKMLAAPEPEKPKVLIGSLTATADKSGATLELSGLENVEAVEGYDAESGQFNAEILVNGTSRGTDYFMKTGEGSAMQAFTDMAAGDTVKVVLKVDPEKTGYDPTPAEASATVTA